MSTRESAREIADQAAEWATRIDGGSVDHDTDVGLRRWLDEDPRRQGALLRAEAALSFVDRGRALAGVIPKPEPRPIWVRRKLMFAGVALAASLVGVAILVTAPNRYDTNLGEIRQVPLSDGSLVAINTQSAVEVSMHQNAREVTLTRGEAWFNVAHDKTRPFIVSAGRIRVRAVGTAFSVRRHDDGADVQVTEGVVETWTVVRKSGAYRSRPARRLMWPPTSRPRSCKRPRMSSAHSPGATARSFSKAKRLTTQWHSSIATTPGSS